MKPSSREYLFLAGDIGGTNTNLALVSHSGDAFRILFSRQYSTQRERSLVDPMERFLKEAAEEGFDSAIDSCCISAAGPVRNNAIQLTNAPWSIDAGEISARFALPVHLVNDFTAISYAVVLLDPHNSEQITHIPHRDASVPMPKEGMALVVGAGTGLGVGFVNKKSDGSYEAFPSEGGHSELPCYDDISLSFHRWLQASLGVPPGVELAVSGQGIVNIFSFACSAFCDPAIAGSLYRIDAVGLARGPGTVARSILEKPEHDRPALVAAHRRDDPHCALAMEMFANFYARKVSSLAAIFLPSGGIYLAGGISSKNEAFLLENHRFMNAFEQNYAPHIRGFLAEVPVMIARNYSVSLMGAANAALQFMK